MRPNGTDLLQAVSGDIEGIGRLLDGGSDPNAAHPVYGNTPLYNACFRDRADVVGLLLSRGADPNRRVTYRSPVDGRVDKDLVALMLARSVDVVSALLAAGADPNAEDQEGRTVLMHSVVIAPPEAVELLLKAGANPHHRSRAGATAADVVRRRLEWLVAAGADLDMPKGAGRKRALEAILTLLAKTEASQFGS